MDTKTKIAGLLALGAGAYFFYKVKEDSQSDIEGINVDVDGDRLIDSLGKKLVQNPVLRDKAVRASKMALGKLLAGRGE